MTQKMNAWHVTTDGRLVRRYGKSLEEIGELTQALNWVRQHGLHALHPDEGCGYLWLEKEVADVICQLELLVADTGMTEHDVLALARFSTGSWNWMPGALTIAISRCLIQGIEAKRPQSEQTNFTWLRNEIADAMANLDAVIRSAKLDRGRIARRVGEKKGWMAQWEALIADEQPKEPAHV